MKEEEHKIKKLERELKYYKSVYPRSNKINIIKEELKKYKLYVNLKNS